MTREQPKLSYVRRVSEWGWVLGSGVYVDDAYKDMQRKVINDIAQLRYNNGVGYFWINDVERPYPRMVMHPTVPSLNGKILDNPKYNCALGRKENLFKAAVEVTEKTGSGFVDYLWPKPTREGLSQVQPKLSFVRRFAPWGWVIGTGIYLDDVEKQVTAAVKRAAEESHRVIRNILLAVLLVLGAGIAATSMMLRRTVTDPLRGVITHVQKGSEQVESASGNIAAAGEELARNTSQQAANLEESVASLEEMRSMTRRTAENAGQATEQMSRTKILTDKGAEASKNLSRAIDHIQESSNEIARIIKTIDEIAFQTNLLALNAAVEAARAGEAGKGFAVVAEEVRNLAQRSADAARDTAALIEDAQHNSATGVDAVGEMTERLTQITGSVMKAKELVDQISRAAQEQAQGIEQINTAVSAMEQVVQSNAANARESAGSAQQLSSQARELNSAVERMTHIVGL